VPSEELNNGAPRKDTITAELLKTSGRYLWENVYQLTVPLWDKEIMPADWKTAVICPTFKKGNKLGCENYGGTSLIM
jgi:hypothetical protein